MTTCQLSKGLTANIFTYFYAEQIVDLISAMMLPKRLAIIKCQAHKKGNGFVKGNNIADLEAKKASGCHTAVLAIVLIEPQLRHCKNSRTSRSL